ncbi:unnamed protein product [Closterium sp. NIES-54]
MGQALADPTSDPPQEQQGAPSESDATPAPPPCFGDHIASIPCMQRPSQTTDSRIKLSNTRNSTPRRRSQHGRHDFCELISDIKALVERAVIKSVPTGESSEAIHLDQPLVRRSEQREQEEEGQQPAARSQEEQQREELQAHERPEASCSGSPARLSPRASQQTQPAAHPQGSTAAHTPRHHHGRDLPSSHRDRHGGQDSLTENGDAVENRANVTTTRAHHAARGIADETDGDQEIVGEGSDWEQNPSSERVEAPPAVIGQERPPPSPMAGPHPNIRSFNHNRKSRSQFALFLARRAGEKR